MLRLRKRLPIWLEQIGDMVRYRGRRVWRSERRLHISLRDLVPSELATFTGELQQALEVLPGVQWARVNPYLWRVIVCVDPAQCGTEAIVREVERVEVSLGLSERPFLRDRPERHPGDEGPLVRTVAELIIEGASLSAGTVLNRLGAKKLPVEFDLAAILSLVENVPGIRGSLERISSVPATELGLELARGVIAALLQGKLGPATDILHRLIRLRELMARQQLWVEREEELCGDPRWFPEGAPDQGVRPREFPRGPIERYTNRAVPASLGGLAAALAARHHLEEAVGTVFAGAPRPARFGRDAFCAHLGRRLARRGVLVINPETLRLLDRIDRLVVVEPTLLEGPVGDSIIAAAAAAELEPITVGRGEELEIIRAFQRDGHGVCLIAAGPASGYGAADVAIGMCVPGEKPPWGADVFVRGGSADAALLIRAIPSARRASRDSVRLSAAEAAVAVAVLFAGMDEKGTARLISLSNVASVVAMGNAVRLAHALDVPELPPEEAIPWHTIPTKLVLSRLGSAQGGLSETAAAARFRPPEPGPSRWSSFASMVVDELKNPMAPVLGAGIGLSALAGAAADAALISGVLVVNAVFAGAERFQTERALAGLGRSERARIKVWREGGERWIAPDRLVLGDVVELNAGDLVPADCRILEETFLEVDQSSLTGESLPVPKGSEPTDAAALAERSSMLYEGTTVAAGSARAVVTAVGEETEARRAIREAGAPPPTGVERRLQSLTALSAPVAAVGGALVAAAGAVRKQPLREVLGSSVGLAVAAVPEGLPLVATMSQLAAARRLSARGALARNPRAVEALGRVDVLCADKTGTLTEGRLVLQVVSDGAAEATLDDLDDRQRWVLSTALRATPSSSNGERLAHVTDRALVEGARSAGVGSHDQLREWRRLGELPFESRRGYHAALARHAGGRLLSVKGAPEVILPLCVAKRRGNTVTALSQVERARLVERSEEMAARGLRVLAVAEREAETERPVVGDRVSELTFAGFVGFADPVRPAARDAVDDIRRAGVQVTMLTGDHPDTARSIARDLGLTGGRTLSGPELDELDDDALDEIVLDVSLYARVTPAHKVRIVRALQRRGKTVAMTGDGANDAPAIRLAEVGIAVGPRASPAARYAADIVVTDERIETIVSALLEGRALWTSVRDAVAILAGGNLGEIAFTLAGGLVGKAPLNARQLLLVNLVTDSLPALVIALRPPLQRSPESLAAEGPEASLGSALVRDVTWRGVLTFASASGAYALARLTGGGRGANSVALLGLTGSQLGQTLAVGGRSKWVWATSLGSMAATAAVVQTPGLSHFFGCRPLGPIGLAQAGAMTGLATGASLIAARWSRRG